MTFSSKTTTKDFNNTTTSNSHAPLILTIDEAIDRLGYGRFQRRILVAVGLCSASDAMEILLLSFLSVAVQVEWQLTPHQGASLIAAVFCGAFVGTLLLGRLGDVQGRKPIFVATAAIVALFGVLSCLCRSFWQLLITRFLVGLGIGGVTVPFDTYSEFLPTNARGKWLSMTSYFWTSGTVMVAIVAHFSLGQEASQWRWLCLYCSIPCIAAVLVGAIVVPESPRWLLLTQSKSNNNNNNHTHNTTMDVSLSTNHHNQNNQQAILATLREAAQINGKNPYLVFPQDTVIVHETTMANNINTSGHSSGYSDVLQLLSPPRLRISLLILMVWFGFACMYYGTVLIITMVFSSITTTTSSDNIDNMLQDDSMDDDFMDDDNITATTSQQATFHFDYGAIFISTLAEVTGATIVMSTIDRFGRQTMHSLSFALGGIVVLLLCLTAAQQGQDKQNQNHRNALVSLAFLARMLIFCGSSITWTWTAELFPSDLRTTGHSIANASGRIGGLVAPFLVSWKKNGSLTTIGTIMALICAMIVTCSRSLPDTHGLPMGSAAVATTTKNYGKHHQRSKVYKNISSSDDDDDDDDYHENDKDGYHDDQAAGIKDNTTRRDGDNYSHQSYQHAGMEIDDEYHDDDKRDSRVLT